MLIFLSILLFVVVSVAIYYIVTPNDGITATEILLEGGDDQENIFNTNSQKAGVTNQKIRELEDKLRYAGMQLDVKKFRQIKILYAVVPTTLSLLCMTLTGALMFKILACVSPFLYFYPNFQLRQNMRSAITNRRLELPGYLKIVATLLKNYTSTKAIKKSVEYAGPYLRPFVEELAMNLETRPGDDLVLKEFAQKLEIAEAHTFVIAIKQATEVNKEGAQMILDDQIKLMDKLLRENYKYLISTKPMAFSKWNFAVVMLILLYPLVILYVTFNQSMLSM
ncbi:hypothetical protein [Exiguobacterium sp. S90]|uniref:hypothetical protein n=1 Tax=Exiguobacterium sp. S90 TaxID=1221231 RepID=UPI0006849562|nr:hypothetical protein [Exiguobacterium sp. S90]